MNPRTLKLISMSNHIRHLKHLLYIGFELNDYEKIKNESKEYSELSIEEQRDIYIRAKKELQEAENIVECRKLVIESLSSEAKLLGEVE